MGQGRQKGGKEMWKREKERIVTGRERKDREQDEKLDEGETSLMGKGAVGSKSTELASSTRV